MTIETLTDRQIKKLRDEAVAAGDEQQTRICDAALVPPIGRREAKAAARVECARVIAEAEAKQ